MNYIKRLILVLNLNPSKWLKTPGMYFTTEEGINSSGTGVKACTQILAVLLMNSRILSKLCKFFFLQHMVTIPNLRELCIDVVKCTINKSEN